MATIAATTRGIRREPVRYDFEIHEGAHLAPPVMQAGNEAFGLFVRCALTSKQSDHPGHVARAHAEFHAHVGNLKPLAARLVEADLWRPERGGWRMVPKPQSFTNTNALWRMRPVYRRDAIPEGLRAEVYKRDGYACLYCGATEDLTLDHIQPWSLGGPDTFENLRVLCRPCNSRKGAKV